MGVNLCGIEYVIEYQGISRNIIDDHRSKSWVLGYFFLDALAS